MRLVDMTGMRVGMLTVIRRARPEESARGVKGASWLCRCDCGIEKVVSRPNLMNGQVSCGCHIRALLKNIRTSHGETVGGKRSREHKTWAGIIRRCEREDDVAYPQYGAKGVRICKRWREDMSAFLADMGRKPSGEHQIDRKNGSGHYSCGRCDECIANGWPANCRWVTVIEQQRNRKSNNLLTYNGKTMCVAEWAERTGLPGNALRLRLSHGWSAERALTSPLRQTSRSVLGEDDAGIYPDKD
jgi:hypothetical protein